jgi:hypothetical protein
MRWLTADVDGLAVRVRSSKSIFLFLAVTLSCGTTSAADRPILKVQPFNWLPWKDALPPADLIIFPMQPAGWLGEQYQYTPMIYSPSTHASVNAVCWPDMRTCSAPDQVLCEIKASDSSEIQVGVSKIAETQQCIPQENLNRLEKGEDFLRGSITYRRGVRP